MIHILYILFHLFAVGVTQNCQIALQPAQLTNIEIPEAPRQFDTLDEAITAAKQNDSLNFARGCIYTLSSTIVNKNVHLLAAEGSAARPIIRCGSSGMRILDYDLGTPDIEISATYWKPWRPLDRPPQKLLIQDLVFSGCSLVMRNPPYKKRLYRKVNAGAIFRLQGRARHIFRNCTFENSSATFGGIGHIGAMAEPVFENCVFRNAEAWHAGAIHIDDVARPTFIKSLFLNATALTKGGSVYTEWQSMASFTKCSFFGKGVPDFQTGYILEKNLLSEERICCKKYNTTGTSCKTSADKGGLIYTNEFSGPMFRSCYFSLGWARKGGAVYTDDESTPIFLNSTFSSNGACHNGGAIYTDDRSAPIFRDLIVSKNFAEQRGGSLFSDDHSHAVYENAIIDWSVAQRGGAFFNDDASTPRYTDVMVLNSHAVNGSGLYINDHADPFCLNVTFKSNNAKEKGGAVFMRRASSVWFIDAIFQNNSAISGGAIFMMDGAVLDLKDSLPAFIDNFAKFGSDILLRNDTTLLISKWYDRDGRKLKVLVQGHEAVINVFG